MWGLDVHCDVKITWLEPDNDRGPLYCLEEAVEHENDELLISASHPCWHRLLEEGSAYRAKTHSLQQQLYVIDRFVDSFMMTITDQNQWSQMNHEKPPASKK